MEIKEPKSEVLKKKSLYVETTIPSLATSRGSSDVIKAGQQAVTKLFWEKERHKYDLYISQYVIDECSLGDSDAAGRRIEFIRGIDFIQKSEEIDALASVYQNVLKIPEKAKTDCFHLACCVSTKIYFLLTWNCTHLGINSYEKIKTYNDKQNLWTPFLVTPNALIDVEEA